MDKFKHKLLNAPFYLNHKETGVQVKNRWKLTENIKEYAQNIFNDPD